MGEAARIPLTLITGFLGSGKTTLIGHMLRDPALAGTLVIVNEFGEVGIDHDLIEASSDDTILLAGGCLCCSIRGNLVDTLNDVLAQRAEGRIRAFDRVVVETSGLADPQPVLAFLFGQDALMRRFRIDGVVTVCAAAGGIASIERHPEAESQVRLADRFVISKCDVAAAGAEENLRDGLRRRNLLADIRRADNGHIEANWVLAPAAELRVGPAPANDGHDRENHDHDGHEHSERVASTVLVPAVPLSANGLARMIAAIRAAAGPELLRIKGLLPVIGEPRHVLIQGAGPSIAEPEPWDRPARTAALVVIHERDSCAGLFAALAALGLKPRAPAQAVLRRR